MKISSKGRYGLKAMVDIAVFGKDKQVSLKSIAERHNISEAYLEQLAAALRRGGLIVSTRGAAGGYALSRPAEQITAGEILRALEGSLTPVECNGGCGDDCRTCVSKNVWRQLGEALDRAADSIRLDQLASDYRNMEDNEL